LRSRRSFIVLLFRRRYPPFSFTTSFFPGGPYPPPSSRCKPAPFVGIYLRPPLRRPSKRFRDFSPPSFPCFLLVDDRSLFDSLTFFLDDLPILHAGLFAESPFAFFWVQTNKGGFIECVISDREIVVFSQQEGD